jgi:hypothetical protein
MDPKMASKPFSTYCYPTGLTDSEIQAHYKFWTEYKGDDKNGRIIAALLEELAEARKITLKTPKKTPKKEKLQKGLDKTDQKQ